MQIEYIDAKTIVTRTKNSYWFGTDYNMNIYRGCCHGCIYCDSRSDCYQVEEFDRVRAKKDALGIIEKELISKRQKGVVGTGSMSDPYNPFEKGLELTRGALELIDRHHFGIAIATKSPLVARDIDILSAIAQYSPVIVKMTITTADDALCKKIERNVAPSSERFEALRRLSDAGIYAGILMMPILPYINDTEENTLQILRHAKESGAQFIYGDFGLTLRDSQRSHYYRMLQAHFPGVREKYRYVDYNQYRCLSPNYKALREHYKAQCKKLGIDYRMDDIIEAYQMKYRQEQMTLF